MSNIDEVNEARKLHPLAVKPVECDESGRQVKIEYVDGCTPPVDDYNFEKAYFCVSGFIPREYQSLISASHDLLEACIALQAEAQARGCGLRIADEAIAKALGQ